MYFKFLRGLSILFSAFFFAYCTAPKKLVKPVEPPFITTSIVPADSTQTDSFLADVLASHPDFFDSVLANKNDWNVQVIYSQVDRGANGIPTLKNYYFNVNAARYFYPASTVKFPACLLALQKLHELNIAGVDKNTTMITEKGYHNRTAVYNDPTSPTGNPSIGQYIKKILMVSDNDANNRLYEFLGQQYLNEELHKRGYGDVQILHRLDISLTADENRYTNPVKFLGPGNDILYQQPLQYNRDSFVTRNDHVGNGFYKAGQLVDEPMDFSAKNRVSLQDLHTMLVSLIFPSKVNAAQRFNLSEDDRKFMLKFMSRLPTESDYPPYAADTVAYWPAYCKFLLFGSEKGSLPENIRIFNKVGDAYGQLTDVAYIVDFDKNIEFFLSATIYCNKDGIINDDKYNYDDTGLPFMKHLGEVLYDYELQRKRKIIPDLSSLKLLTQQR